MTTTSAGRVGWRQCARSSRQVSPQHHASRGSCSPSCRPLQMTGVWARNAAAGVAASAVRCIFSFQKVILLPHRMRCCSPQGGGETVARGCKTRHPPWRAVPRDRTWSAVECLGLVFRPTRPTRSTASRCRRHFRHHWKRMLKDRQHLNGIQIMFLLYHPNQSGWFLIIGHRFCLLTLMVVVLIHAIVTPKCCSRRALRRVWSTRHRQLFSREIGNASLQQRLHERFPLFPRLVPRGFRGTWKHRGRSVRTLHRFLAFGRQLCKDLAPSIFLHQTM